ncbi:MAG: hypothetical protein ORN51_10685 [Akkermansiaceae bacterium]|nr:hypothetical protein [Akkermansiaceae bacterium]
MKPTFILGLSALALAATASADVTINVTGATAFRSAALTSIKAKFAAGGSYKYAHDQASGSLTSSTYSIFIGTFPGISGTTTMRCCFTGSVEGIRALALAPASDPSPPKYLPASVATTAAAASGGETASVATSGATTADSDIAFSDVTAASTPYASSASSFTTDAVGVIVFTMMTNEGSTITNVTSQQYRSLLTQGYQPKSLFTGVASDTSNVFAVGRNDASGTRTTVLAEIGYGITTSVNQYFTNTTSGNTITQLKLCDTSATYASTVWGQNIAGNGGYVSGSGVKTAFGLTSNSTQVVDETGAESFAAAPISLITWLGVSDAGSAKTAGGVLCAYNGVSLDLAGTSNALSTADKAKIANGSYTAWGYERMFRKNSASTDVQTAYTGIKTAVPANIGSAGLPITDLAVGRSTDGGNVAPIN